jgi:hypothetical protein
VFGVCIGEQAVIHRGISHKPQGKSIATNSGEEDLLANLQPSPCIGQTSRLCTTLAQKRGRAHQLH